MSENNYYLGFVGAEILSVKVYDKYAFQLGIQGKIDSCPNQALVGQTFFDNIKLEKYYASKEKSFAKVLHQRQLLNFSDEVREKGLSAMVDQMRRSVGAVQQLVGHRVSVLVSGYERKKGNYDARAEDGFTTHTIGDDKRKVHLSQLVIADYDSAIEGEQFAKSGNGYSEEGADSSDVDF